MMARIGSGTPPDMLGADQQADEALVIKSIRVLQLLRDGNLLPSYPISLGAALVGHKQTESDERTPEEKYTIDWRNPSSMAHLSLHISYPNTAGTAAATDNNQMRDIWARVSNNTPITIVDAI